jgi:hypothetical protein
MSKTLAALLFIAAHTLTLVLLAGAAGGGVMAQTPTLSTSCQRDLAEADALVSAVQDRDKQFTADDDARNCTLMRRNRVEMIVATRAIQRCLTGRDRDENVGQMEASLADIDEVLARKCR